MSSGLSNNVNKYSTTWIGSVGNGWYPLDSQTLFHFKNEEKYFVIVLSPLDCKRYDEIVHVRILLSRQ